MILSHVRKSGKLKRGGTLVELLVDAFGERAADAFHARQILDTRSQHALKSTEVLEEPLAAPRTHRGNLLEARRGARLAAARAMPRDREAVRLVADLLDQVQRRMIGRQATRLFLARDEELLHAGLALHTLGHADHADVMQAEVLHHRLRSVDLPEAAVDEDQVRCLALALRELAVAHAQRIAHRTIV